ncbi:MAG: C40 family peptidase [Oligoflexus sp.]|jgi:cell wall-associated NlpC family hydrolase|nr:C40 family peptidase [Pseudopedobacter sp.]
MIKFLLISVIYLFSNCNENQNPKKIRLKSNQDSIITRSQNKSLERTAKKNTPTQPLPNEIIDYAKTLIGVPYKYGSTDISQGLDCSGFITSVYNRFNIKVPRSSVDFTDYGKKIEWNNVKPGDLILFTGTDSTKKPVGHMGIITETNQEIKFIHSTSGKAYSVTITPLNKYYQGRFVKIIRIL